MKEVPWSVLTRGGGVWAKTRGEDLKLDPNELARIFASTGRLSVTHRNVSGESALLFLPMASF